MAIELPDPQAKTRIVSETPARCQCCHFDQLPGRGGCRTAWQAGLKSADVYPAPLFLVPSPPAGCRSCARRRLMQPAQLLALLAEGEPLSGAGLAGQAGVTRAAIWKQVEALRARGVPIEARGTAGYRLPWSLQMLDAEEIRAALPTPLAHSLGALEVHWELDSTSSELQRRGAAARDFSVVLAETQSAGRGRRGRPWLSPPGLNVYLSCLKRFESGFAALSGLSLAIGVIVLRALDSLGIAGAGLKWPNDLLAAGHDEQPGGKLGGILVELSGEYQGPCAAIIGIGLNLRLTPALHEQAAQPACDLATLAGGTPPDRNRVVAALIAALVEGLRQFERDGFAAFGADYARHDLLLGQPLQLSGALGAFDGVGAGVDARGALQVRMADGSMRRIDSADVTVRRA
jgi:BirA family biotin operon repressor/biotin-[acetyl-CoA-carboxylase] ligase